MSEPFLVLFRYKFSLLTRLLMDGHPHSMFLKTSYLWKKKTEGIISLYLCKLQKHILYHTNATEKKKAHFLFVYYHAR